jgi:hypothetical protein
MPFAVTARNAEQAIEPAIKEYHVPERERFRISVRCVLGVDRLPAAAETRRVYNNAISTAEIASASAAFFMNETIPWVLSG